MQGVVGITPPQCNQTGNECLGGFLRWGAIAAHAGGFAHLCTVPVRVGALDELPQIAFLVVGVDQGLAIVRLCSRRRQARHSVI